MYHSNQTRDIGHLVLRILYDVALHCNNSSTRLLRETRSTTMTNPPTGGRFVKRLRWILKIIFRNIWYYYFRLLTFYPFYIHRVVRHTSATPQVRQLHFYVLYTQHEQRDKTHSNPKEEHITKTHYPLSRTTHIARKGTRYHPTRRSKGKSYPWRKHKRKEMRRRWARSCDHLLGLVWDIIQKRAVFIHLDPILLLFASSSDEFIIGARYNIVQFHPIILIHY